MYVFKMIITKSTAACLHDIMQVNIKAILVEHLTNVMYVAILLHNIRTYIHTYYVYTRMYIYIYIYILYYIRTYIPLW